MYNRSPRSKIANGRLSVSTNDLTYSSTDSSILKNNSGTRNYTIKLANGSSPTLSSRKSFSPTPTSSSSIEEFPKLRKVISRKETAFFKHSAAPVVGEHEVHISLKAVSLSSTSYSEQTSSSVNEGSTHFSISGIVVDRGAKVTSVSRGARVFGVCSEQELFADYSVTNCLNVCELPCDIDFKDGAVMGLDYLVAWDILHEKLKVHSAPASTKCGNRVLVKNAEVSIGLASCQLASLRGMCVLAETNSESSLHFMEHSVGGIKEAFIAGSRQRDQVKTEQRTPSKNCCSNLESHRDNVYKRTHSEETGHNEGKGQHGLNCGAIDVGSCYVTSQCHSTALSKWSSTGRISCSMRSKNMAGKCCEVDYVIDNSTTHRGSHLSHHHIGHRIKQGTKCHHTIDLSCLSNNGKVVLVDRGSSHGGKSVLIDNCSLLVGKNVTICGCGIENISLEQRAKILPEISSLFAKRQLKAHVVKSYPRELLRHNNVKSVSLKRQQFGNAVLLFNSLSETL